MTESAGLTTLRALRHLYGAGTMENFESLLMSRPLGSTRSVPSTVKT